MASALQSQIATRPWPVAYGPLWNYNYPDVTWNGGKTFGIVFFLNFETKRASFQEAIVLMNSEEYDDNDQTSKLFIKQCSVTIVNASFFSFISFDNHPKYNTNTTNTIHNSKYMKIKIYMQRKNNEN